MTKAVEEREFVHPLCVGPGCTNPVLRREGETVSRWMRRVRCGPGCTKGVGRRPGSGVQKHPPCKGCGYAVRRSGGTSIKRWMEQEFCTRECMLEHNGTESGWPEQTGWPIKGRPFAWFDRDPGDGGLFRTSRPATDVQTSSSMGDI